jgi:beta-lactamase class A
MSVGLVDLSDPADVRFASVNGDLMMYAASLPKIAVLLAAHQALEERRIQETPTVLNDADRMIKRSDNAAATRLIDALGYKYIASVLTSPGYRFYDQNNGGGLWVGKRYARSGARNPDPLKGLSHAASVNQVCRFYYLLATDHLLSEKRNRQMLASLSDTEINHKFVHALNRIAPEAQLYRKSGTWRAWHSDSVLVMGPDWRRYILVALLEDSNGEQCLRELVPAVESVLQSSN